MIIGANAYAPGLTVRWNDIGDDWASLFAPRVGCLLMIAKVSYWTVSTLSPLPRHRPGYTRRCDAKRAAEVLVGQWWREKCEREWLARRYALATSDGLVAAFKRMGETAREAAERFNVLTAKGGDLDRLAEVYGVEARGE